MSKLDPLKQIVVLKLKSIPPCRWSQCMASQISPLLHLTQTPLTMRVKTSKSSTTGWLAAWTRLYNCLDCSIVETCWWYLFDQVRLLQQAKQAFAGLPEMEDRSEDIAALKNRFKQNWLTDWLNPKNQRGMQYLHPGTKENWPTGRISTLLPWESLPKPRRGLNFLGDVSFKWFSFFWREGLPIHFVLQQPELWVRGQAQWKGIQTKGKSQPIDWKLQFWFFLEAGFPSVFRRERLQ